MKLDEVWKPIKGTLGKYKISNLGNVIGVKGNRLKPTKMQIGYLSIAISIDGIPKRHYIHILVASHFLPKPEQDGLVINHKDGNKHNNFVSNLEYVSRKANAKHWAIKNRSSSAGRKRNGYCGRGHRLVGDRTYCLECQRLNKAGVKFEPPNNCNWRHIPDTDYLVSDTGLVWSNKTKRVLRCATDTPGYKYVILRVNGKNKRHSVHRLVAAAFIERIKDDFIVDHINSNKSDNHYMNLRIITRQQNSLLSREKIRVDGEHGFKFDEVLVGEMKWLAENTCLLQKDIEKHYGISQSLLSAILIGKSWKHVEPLEPQKKDLELEKIAVSRMKKKREIREIKWLVQNTDFSQKEIAQRYSVSIDTVSSIKVGRNHGDVEPIKPNEIVKS